MGLRRFGTKLYYHLSLGQLVPQDHLLRRIAAAVDFSFVHPLCSYKNSAYSACAFDTRK